MLNARLIPSREGTQFVAFDGVGIVPANAIPCLFALLRVVDSPVTMDIRPSDMGQIVESDPATRCPVGSIFADVILSVTAADMSSMQYHMARIWIEILIAFILKVR